MYTAHRIKSSINSNIDILPAAKGNFTAVLDFFDCCSEVNLLLFETPNSKIEREILPLITSSNIPIESQKSPNS